MQNPILKRKIQKIEVKNFPILNIKENFLKFGKIIEKVDVKKNVTFDFVELSCWFSNQFIGVCWASFDQKSSTLGAFFQKLRFFYVMSVIIMQVQAAFKEKLAKLLPVKTSKWNWLYKLPIYCTFRHKNPRDEKMFSIPKFLL